MIDVVVMGQFYGGEYLVEDFCGCCSALGTLDQYSRNEDWNSWNCCLWSCSLLPY